MATYSKLAIYNDAIQHLGQRRLTSLTDDVELRYRLDTEWDLGAVEFCLDAVKPYWSTKVIKLDNPSITDEHGMNRVHNLPADYIAFVSLFSESKLDQNVNRYFIQGRTIQAEYDVMWLRYVSSDGAQQSSDIDYGDVELEFYDNDDGGGLHGDWNPGSGGQYDNVYEAMKHVEDNETGPPFIHPSYTEEPDDGVYLTTFNGPAGGWTHPDSEPVSSGSQRSLHINHAAAMAHLLINCDGPGNAGEADYHFNGDNQQLTDFGVEWADGINVGGSGIVRYSIKNVSEPIPDSYAFPVTEANYQGAALDSDNIWDEGNQSRFGTNGILIGTLDNGFSITSNDPDDPAIPVPLTEDQAFQIYQSSSGTSSFLNWTPNFARVVGAYLASKLAPAVNPNKTAPLNTMLADLVETATKLEGFKEPQSRSSQSSFEVNPVWLKIYNDALQIMGLQHMIDEQDDSQARSALDIALDNDLVEDALEEINWSFPHKIVKITYDPSLEPDWGYRRVFNKPEDIVRLRGMFCDEYQRVPLKSYTEEGENFYADYDEIWLDYIPSDLVEDPVAWPTYFRKFIAASLANAAAPSLRNFGANIENTIRVYEERMNKAKNVDAITSPPQVIHQGNWTKAKTNIFRRSNSFLGRP